MSILDRIKRPPPHALRHRLGGQPHEQSAVDALARSHRGSASSQSTRVPSSFSSARERSQICVARSHARAAIEQRSEHASSRPAAVSASPSRRTTRSCHSRARSSSCSREDGSARASSSPPPHAPTSPQTNATTKIRRAPMASHSNQTFDGLPNSRFNRAAALRSKRPSPTTADNSIADRTRSHN